MTVATEFPLLLEHEEDALAQVKQMAVLRELDEIGRKAQERMAACSFDLVGPMGGATIDFMTPEELARRHALMMSLPTQAEERMRAQRRIQQRIASRRAARRPPPPHGPAPSL